MLIRNLEAVFSFKFDQAKLKQATSSLDKFASHAKLAVGAIAGSAAIQSINNFMNNTAAALDQVGKTSSKLGIAEEALQEFRFAAEQSGVAANTFDMALQRFIRRSSEAAKGTGEAKDALKELGVSVTDSAGALRDPIKMFAEVADAMAGMENQGDKVRLAMRLFDTEGVALVNMLQGGSQNIKNLRYEARELGFVFGKDATDKAALFGDAMNRLNKSVGGLSTALSVNLTPAYTRIADFSARLAASINKLETHASALRVAMLALGGVITAIGIKLFMAFSPAIITITAIGAGIAAAALIIDDLWVAFKGGDSVFLALHKSAREFFGPIEQWIADLPGQLWGSFKAMANMLPDFFKTGFDNIFKIAGDVTHNLPDQNRFAPSQSTMQSHTQNTANQNISVAVNMKSNANPREVGVEVSKAVRKELEKERFNAFMGVSQYAS